MRGNEEQSVGEGGLRGEDLDVQWRAEAIGEHEAWLYGGRWREVTRGLVCGGWDFGKMGVVYGGECYGSQARDGCGDEWEEWGLQAV